MEIANFFWYGKQISLYEEMSLKSFIQNGFEVIVWGYTPLDLPKGATLRYAGEILHHDHLFKYTQGGESRNLAAFSDVFRYNLLAKKPGEWWFDIDCICVKHADEFAQLKQNKKFVAAWEDPDKRSANCAVITMPDKKFAEDLVRKQKHICDTVSDIPWAGIGPRLLTSHCIDTGLADEILPMDTFYPIGYWETNKFYNPEERENTVRKCKGSYIVHLWNEILSREGIDKTVWPNEDSYLYELFNNVINPPKPFNDKALQRHELDFWVEHDAFNRHVDFYKEFFDFAECNEKELLDVGCGGNPVSDFIDCTIKLSILDPLIDSLIASGKYDNLLAFPKYSMSILDFQEKNKYDIVTCLNVIDHFNDEELKFIDVFYDALKDNGQLWLYYDLRPVNACDHLAVDHSKIIKALEERFTIIKMSEDINPKHIGWSGITNSIRLIAIKK